MTQIELETTLNKILRRNRNTIMWLIFCFIISFTVIGPWVADYDSTDYHKERSGLTLRIDALTGCHYLTTWSGNIIKRTNTDGEHICTGKELK